MDQVLKLSLKKNLLTELVGIENFPNVKFLKLSRNELVSYGEVQRLGQLKNLKGLSLYKNPIETNENYINKILTVCPFLESLDHNEVNNDTKPNFVEEPKIVKKESSGGKLKDLNHHKEKKIKDSSNQNANIDITELEKNQNQLKMAKDSDDPVLNYKKNEM